MISSSAGVLYDSIGVGYATARREDPRWRAAILAALGGATSVINVGAGAGSYEPDDRPVLAVEPSAAMIAQRAVGAAPCVQGVAERLPAADNAFEGAMGVLTAHHWSDWRRGLAEMRRVAQRQVIVATDTVRLGEFWLARDYVPELVAYERSQVTAAEIASELGTDDIRIMWMAADFTDAVYPAFWCRPEAFLDAGLWQHSSALAKLDPAIRQRAIARLSADLAEGAWHARNADLIDRTEFDGGFRLVVSP